jgi:hypothetical protein
MSGLDHIWQDPRPEAGTLGPVTENVLEQRSDARRWLGQRHLAVLVVAVIAATAVVAWLFMHKSSAESALAGGGPVLLSQSQLERLASTVDHPLYWAGPKAGYSYETTVTRGGRIYVRYLPSGARAGDPRASFLVVGTYTEPGAFVDLKRAAKQNGSVSVGIDRGGIVVFSSQRPTSVYFSYPGAKYQVEVYSPSGDAARSMVLGGKITPIRPAG